MPKQKLQFKNFEWSPNLAYAVGLLVTDGCLSKDGRHITMRSVDIDLLNAFKKSLNIDSPIGTSEWNGRVSHRVSISNVQLYNWLKTIGVHPAKSYTVGKINLPDQYFRDFLRGHLDGDGCIRLYRDNYVNYKGRTYNNLRLYINFISASKEHMLWLHDKITKLAKTKGAFMELKPKLENRVSIWAIKLSKKDSVILLQWIYYENNLPCLKRKRQLAEKALNLINEERRKKYAKL